MSTTFGVPVTEVLASVRAQLDSLAALAPWQLLDTDIATMVVQAEALSRRLAGVQLAVIAEGIGRGLPFATGSGTGQGAPAAWVRSLIPVTPGQASGRARLAQALFAGAATGPTGRALATVLEPTRDAVLAETISTGHAQAITTAMTTLTPPTTPDGVIDQVTLTGAQQMLLSYATGTSAPDGSTAPDGSDQTAALDPRQLNKAVVALTATLDPGAGDRLAADEDAQHRLRALSVTPDSTGMYAVTGRLTAECGALLRAALDAGAAPRPATDGTPDPRPAQARTHDSLHNLLKATITTPGLLPTTHGSPVRLVVSVDAATLLTHGQPGVTRTGVPMAQLPGGWPLSPLTATTMACDADLVAILTGPDGSPLDVGDTIYPFTTKQRTAVTNRDQHCTYPTCTAPPAWCDLHHLESYSAGGPTSTDNAALLCGVHHRYVHAHHLTGTRTRDGTTTWQAPTGTHNPHTPPPTLTRAINNLAKRWHDRNPQQRTNTHD